MSSKIETQTVAKGTPQNQEIRIAILRQKIEAANREIRVKYSELETLKRMVILKKAELQAKEDLQNERKSKFENFPPLRKRKAEIDFTRAGQIMHISVCENTRLKGEIEAIYNKLSMLKIPYLTYTEKDAELDMKTIEYLEKSNNKRKIYLMHIEELVSFINSKMEQYNEQEKQQKQMIEKLQETKKTNQQRNVKAITILSRSSPSNIENEVITDELEKDVIDLTNQLKSMDAEIESGGESGIKERAMISVLEDENKDKRPILEHRLELLEEEKRNYVVPKVETNNFNLSPTKSNNELNNNRREGFETIIDQISSHLKEMQETCQKEEDETNELQKEFLEKRNDIEASFFKKAQQIRDASNKINKAEDLDYEIKHIQRLVDESNETLKDIQTYKARLIRINKSNRGKLTNEERKKMTLFQKKQLEMDQKMPPVSSVSPKRTSQELHLAQKSRQIEMRQRTIDLLRSKIETLKQEVEEKENNIREMEEKESL